MLELDFTTLLVNGVMLMALSAAILFPVWWQNRQRSPETLMWFVGALMQLVALVLMGLRGAIPDVVSIVLANGLVVGGTIVLYAGLERHVGESGRQVHNYVILVVFILIQAYLTFIEPDLALRSVNLAVALALVTAQGAWLMLHEVDPGMRPATRGPGIVFLGLMVVNVVSIPFNLTATPSENLLEPGLVRPLSMLSMDVLFVALTLTILLMMNRRLVVALEEDIAKRISAQKALESSETKFYTAFRTSPDAVNINRLSDGLYLDINEGFTKLTGFTQQDVAGKTSAEISIWNDPQDRVRLVEGLVAEGTVNNLEAEFRRKDGTLTTALMSAQVIDVEGEQCILSVTRDISERRVAEDEIRHLNSDLERRVQERTEALTLANEQLMEANIKLDEATRAKSDFLASMSHELRTPLNSIIGFSDILVRGMAGKLEPEQERQIGMIHTSGKHLLDLVNEVLDVSAIEAGRMRVERQPVDVEELVRVVTDSLTPLAAEKGLRLSWTLAPEAAGLVSDRMRVEQVLFNLMGNAIKFTDAGSVSLEVRRTGDDIEFVLSDTGCGISPEDQRRIFDEFYQVRQSDLSKSSGTGLGLTVSRKLMDMLGGTIEVESRLGVGSTFTVRLPVDA